MCPLSLVKKSSIRLNFFYNWLINHFFCFTSWLLLCFRLCREGGVISWSWEIILAYYADCRLVHLGSFSWLITLMAQKPWLTQWLFSVTLVYVELLWFLVSIGSINILWGIWLQNALNAVSWSVCSVQCFFNPLDSLFDIHFIFWESTWVSGMLLSHGFNRTCYSYWILKYNHYMGKTILMSS